MIHAQIITHQPPDIERGGGRVDRGLVHLVRPHALRGTEQRAHAATTETGTGSCYNNRCERIRAAVTQHQGLAGVESSMRTLPNGYRRRQPLHNIRREALPTGTGSRYTASGERDAHAANGYHQAKRPSTSGGPQPLPPPPKRAFHTHPRVSMTMPANTILSTTDHASIDTRVRKGSWRVGGVAGGEWHEGGSSTVFPSRQVRREGPAAGEKGGRGRTRA